MSNVKALADKEAEKAEAESPDEQEAQEEEETTPAAPPDAPEAPESPESDDESAEAIAKKLDKEMTRHERALCKLFGVDELPPSPFPFVLGFAMPGAIEMRAHDDFQQCQVCNGHGRVLTGSLRPGEETRDCPEKRCGGRGYWAKRTTPIDPPVEAVAAANGAHEEWETPAWMGDTSISSPPAPMFPAGVQ